MILCFAIALPAWHLGRAFPLMGGPIAAILAGVIISLIVPNLLKFQFGKGFTFSEGIKFTSKKLLQYSIVLLGFEMNLFNVFRVGSSGFLGCAAFHRALAAAFGTCSFFFLAAASILGKA